MCGLFKKDKGPYLVCTDPKIEAECQRTAKKIGLKMISADGLDGCGLRSAVFVASTMESFGAPREEIAERCRNRFAVRNILFCPRYKFSSDKMQELIARMDEILTKTPGIVSPYLISNDICKWETARRFSDSLNTSTCDIRGIPANGDFFIIFYEEECLN